MSDAQGRRVRTEAALRREIGLVAGTLVGVNAMIGTGIFKKSAPIARLVGSIEAMMLVWVAGGVIALAGALSLAELAAAMPRTGGLYEYIRRAFGETPAFLLGYTRLVLLIPSAVTFVWFTVMGGTALHSELLGAGGLVEAVNEKGAPVSLFALLAQYPAATLTSTIAMFLVAIFFVSGADAASVVMGMLSSHGTLHPKPGIVVLWGLLAGASACVLLVMGGLAGLQTASIIAAAPFLLVMVGLCVSLWMGLLDDIEAHGRFEQPDVSTVAKQPA